MNIFEIIGPVMVGPSSSHTAGAVRIGFVARNLLGEEVKEAEILLYGSFLATGRGHGTDRALVGGLMGMKPDDYRIPNSIEIAKERGTTRAAVSMEMAAKIEKPVIFAIGNAPTALIQLYEMIQNQSYRPAFIIGVPVGFVNVEAAKELIMETDVPYIVNRGRKGGSNVAAAICNALIYELGRKER